MTYRPDPMRAMAIGLAALALLATGCESTDLRPINRTVTVQGHYCTNDATTFNVPIRILLVVDTSESMKINDPGGNRGRAASSLIDGISKKGLDASFAFIHFDTAATQLTTTGFTKDRAALNATIGGLNLIQGFTNYLDALGLAKTVINDDIRKTAAELHAMELKGLDTRYRRPWYFVVFLSDGIPRMPGGVLQSTDSILFQVDQLMSIPKEASGITLHTAFLGASDDALRPDAEVLLKRMAVKGHGTYFSFTSGDQIDFNVFDFQIKRLFEIKQLLAYNRSAALPDGSQAPEPDSDQDGLSDAEELKLGTDPLLADSDHDGLGDGFEVKVALDPLHPNMVCNTDASQDSDHDGLNDCEETFLNLDKARFDTDHDLFPDRLELLSGTNPGDTTDTLTDLDFDGVNAGQELRMRTKVKVADKEQHDYYGYQYEVVRQFDSEKGTVCYDYQVHNIGLTRTQEMEGRPAGVNDVVLDFIETPEDSPEKSFSLNRLVVPVQYADYGLGTIDATDLKFQSVSTMEVPAQ